MAAGPSGPAFAEDISARDAIDRRLPALLPAGKLSGWTSFIPTYAKLTVAADGSVTSAALRDYRRPDQR